MKLVKFNLEIVMPERWMKKFIQMLDCMRWCSRVGASRTVAFYADGDGDFSGVDFKFQGTSIDKTNDWEKVDKEPTTDDKNYPKPFHTNRPINFFFDAG